jgi:hypothetical protein
MAFDCQAAMRAAGINPDEIAPEHRQLVCNDLRNRGQNDPAFRQRLVQERAKAAHGLAAPQPEPAAPQTAPEPAAPQAAQPSPRRASPMSPLGTAVGMAAAIPAMQGLHMAGMHQDVMSAIEKENYSRVSQSRERRRMQHEKDKEAARMQHEKDVLLMRLRAMRGE